MEFIDKTILKKEGEAIIFSFLKRLEIENNPYPKDLYDVFKSDRNDDGILMQDLFINVLLKEQENRCCYCMRRLDSDDEKKTLEHLIPQSIEDQATFNKYLNTDTVLNKTNVCLTKDFINEEKCDFPPFPHTVAYQNLTVSCNGKIATSGVSNHCNLKRGDDFIEPFILYSDIKNEIRYEANGYVFWRNKKETLKPLELNCKQLRMIRRIWFFASSRHINLLEVDETQKINFLIQMQKVVPVDEWGTLNNFKNGTYWKLLKKYDYFFINNT